MIEVVESGMMGQAQYLILFRFVVEFLVFVLFFFFLIIIIITLAKMNMTVRLYDNDKGLNEFITRQYILS